MPRQQEELTVLRVDNETNGMRLDAFLVRHLKDFSRSRIQRIIDSGDVLVDGKLRKASFVVERGQQVSFAIPPPSPSPLTPVAIPLDILFEDDSLIVINKPAGLVVHPGAGTGDTATLVHGLLHHGSDLSESTEAGFDRPGIVHRLDKDTTGAMVVAKNDETHAALARQFQEKTNLREYVALLDGVLLHRETIRESYLYRDPKSRVKFASIGRNKYEADGVGGRDPSNYRLAISHFSVSQTFQHRLTLARVRLQTGRTHQIRVHACDLGAPVVGDLVYHRPCQLPSGFPDATRSLLESITRQMLHARLLGFVHPKSGQDMRFEAPLPKDFQALLDHLAPLADSNGHSV